jgi:ribosomal protein L9
MSLFDITEDEIQAAPAAAAAPALFKEPCKKCKGSGRWVGGFVNTTIRKCFSCSGRGFHEYKTSGTQRAAARESASKRKAAEVISAANKADAWKAANPAAADWLANNSGNFAASLSQSLARYGSLTDNQLAAVLRCAAADIDRKAAAADRVAAAPTLEIGKIEQAFQTAKDKGIKRPKMRLDSFVFSPAPESGKNAGAIYVKAKDEEGTYLGKIMQGKFLRSRECDQERESAVLAAAADPEAAAVAYGRRFGACSLCGRTLTVGESIDRGIGPICAETFGF